MRRVSKSLIAILFPMVLAAYPLSILLPVEPAQIENRALEPPDLSLDNVTSLSMYLDFLNYVLTANPLRAVLIRSAANIDYQLFDDSPDPREVIKGNDGWLYYRPTLESGCGAKPEHVVDNVQDLIRRLESTGATVVFTVAPSKFIIHPEYLTEVQARLGACTKENGARLRRLLAAAPITHYVDSWMLFEDMKVEGVQPYFTTDTHFNFVGSIPWIRSLIEEIADIWDPNDVIHLGDTLWLGNLTTFAALDQPERVEHVVVRRQVDVLEVAVEDREALYRVSGPDPTIDGKTIILGDSFMELPRPSIVQFFEDVAALDWRQASSMDYFLENATSSDVIIIEVSELDIWDRFEDGTLFEDLETTG